MRPCPRATGALVVVLAVGAGSGALAQVPSRSARVVDYRIEASLDPSAHRVDGRQRLTWRNPSSTDTVGEVWFHLYLNAFRNSQSTFLRERPALRASMAGTDDAWGSIVLTSFRLAGGADLAKQRLGVHASTFPREARAPQVATAGRGPARGSPGR